jgi:2-oxoisovalerate dehydrogenase E1 component
VTSPAESRLHRAALVRLVEEQLLALFSAGKLAGTTHTCIGQELSAIALADSLDAERDIIFSNHRCHGHYLAWTDDVEGLLAEVMGKRSGVCGGLGGSQHLCGRGFFSNGVQGGIVPVAAGLAFAKKIDGQGGIVAVCIGDGTLGEGVIYETFNIVAKWQLPLLIVLENNLYAQSTSQSETLAGDIQERVEAFGIGTYHGDTWNPEGLANQLRWAVESVRSRCVPAFVRVDTYRLAAHSKGDDDRDPAEIQSYAVRDPVNELLARLSRDAGAAPLVKLKERVRRAVERADKEPLLELRTVPQRQAGDCRLREVPIEPGTQLEAINRALHRWMAEDSSVVVIGEDIRSPYGGAFKVTRGLSNEFPDRVLNTPISEAAIVGVGNGLALGGKRPVVEIMFGDFLTLCFDQILNHAAKFRGMYNGQVANPLIVRTPMGAGRGYGPTHSQNLEKHFVGIPGLNVCILHGRARVHALYEALRAIESPFLIVENKLLYRERGDAPLPAGYSLFEAGERFPATVLRPASEPDITIVAFGRMSVLAEQAAAHLAREEEVQAELIFPLSAWPLDIEAVLQSVAGTRKLLVVEEGAAGFDLGSEVIAAVSLAYRGSERLYFRRLAATPVPIPSALALEQQVLPNVETIVQSSLDLFDE